MSAVAAPEVRTRNQTRLEVRTLTPEWLQEAIRQAKARQIVDFHAVTVSPTVAGFGAFVIKGGQPADQDLTERGSQWGTVDLDWTRIGQIPPITRATTPTATTVSSVRKLLRMRRLEERISRLPSDRRALYERIARRREKVGPVKLDIVEALRELRENG